MQDGNLPRITDHKRIRLDPVLYRDPSSVCSITIAVQHRRRVFAAAATSAAALQGLREHAAKTGVTIYGFCIMPDHIHLVMSPSGYEPIARL